MTESPEAEPPGTDSAVRGLPPEDRARLSGYRRPEDRKRFLLGRLLARDLLHREHGIPSAEFVATEFGRPLIRRPVGSGVDFNISHSGAWVACATTSAGTVGVDVVRLEEFSDWRDLAPGYLSEPELAFLCGRDESAGRLLAARLWAAKEAVLKAMGTGLSCDPRRLVLDLAERPLVAAAPPFMGGYRFGIGELSPTNGCHVCIALARPRGCGRASRQGADGFAEGGLEVMWVDAASLIRRAGGFDDEAAGIRRADRAGRAVAAPQPPGNHA